MLVGLSIIEPRYPRLGGKIVNGLWVPILPSKVEGVRGGGNGGGHGAGILKRIGYLQYKKKIVV
jgi:hypothetical protein